MKVSTERIPEAQIVMTIEVEPERLDEAREKAVRKLSPRAKVPGFRPGKAPAAMVRRYFGEERVTDEALDVLVPVVYREAVEADESIDPIARARLVVETIEPLVVKATIPIRPSIDLGDYEAIRIATEHVTVDESRIDETIEILRRRASTLEPIEREIAWRDVVRMDVKGTVNEDEQLVDQKDVEIQLVEDRDVLFPGFEEELLGHKKGDALEFELQIPETLPAENLAGKQAHFAVTITETKEEVLPELDEAFLKSVGEGFADVDALRQRIREDVERAEGEQRDNRYHDAILGELVERATIEFPPVMLESEVERMLHDQAGHQEHGEEMERYLASIGKTEDEARAELQPVADARLRRSLVLGKVADAEHIEVAADEVEAEIEKMTASAGAQAQQLRSLFTSENGRETISRNLLTRKTLARLVEIATQDGDAAVPTAQRATAKDTDDAGDATADDDAGDATHVADETVSEGGTEDAADEDSSLRSE